MVFDDHGMRHSPSVRGYQGWALGVHINDSLRLVLSMQPSAVFINAMQCLSMQAGKQGSCGGKCDGSDASMKGNRKCHGNQSLAMTKPLAFARTSTLFWDILKAWRQHRYLKKNNND